MIDRAIDPVLAKLLELLPQISPETGAASKCAFSRDGELHRVEYRLDGRLANIRSCRDGTADTLALELLQGVFALVGRSIRSDEALSWPLSIPVKKLPTAIAFNDAELCQKALIRAVDRICDIVIASNFPTGDELEHEVVRDFSRVVDRMKIMVDDKSGSPVRISFTPSRWLVDRIRDQLARQSPEPVDA